MTPESRSRELAAKATAGPWERENHNEVWHVVWHGDIPAKTQVARGIFTGDDAAFIAFHDPALITAYADVVEAARASRNVNRDWIGHHAAIVAIDAALASLDALAKDQGE